MNLPRFSLNRKTLVLTVLALALFWSVVSALTMQRREDPGTTQRQTEVVTRWPGATTGNVEELVTKKIVDDLRGVEHVDHVEGTSRPGISDVSVIFDDAINDADGPLRDVRNHLNDLRPNLPAAIDGPTMIGDVWQTYPMIVGITAQGYDARALRDLAKHLSDGISRLPDVGSVKIVGEQHQQVDVDADLTALASYGISANDVIGSLQNRNQILPNASVPLGGRLTQIDPNTALRGANDVAQTLIAARDGRTVRIADVANVHTGYPDPPDEIVHIAGTPGIALAIRAKETSSVTDLGPSVEAYLAAATARWPAGVHAVLVANQPRIVHNRVADFVGNLATAMLVVTGLVALFMGLRNGVLVGVTVVLSITLTLGAMPLLHIDINQISILALIISLGIIVDAGIVAIDNIEHHLREGDSRFDAASHGVASLWMPLLTSTLVAMSSFLPFRLMGGGIGDFVRDLSVVTCISLAMSLLVAYFVTPILGEWFAVPSNASGGNPVLRRVRDAFDGLLEQLRRVYPPVARRALAHPRTTVAIALAVFVAAVMWVPHLGVQFFPSADRDQFFIGVNAPEGTDIRTTERVVSQIERILATKRGITTWGAFIGQGAPRFYYNVLSEQPKPSYAQILVDTVDVPTASALVPELQQDVRAVAGARIEVKKIEQGPPVGAPIQLRLTGDDPQALARASSLLQGVLASVAGVTNVRDSLGIPSTTLTAQIDENRAAASSVNDAAIADALSLAYGGRTVTQIRESDRETPVVVRLPDAQRSDPQTLAGLGVRNDAGASVPLGEVATFAPQTQTSIATYRDGSPSVLVSADVDGRLASDALNDFKHALARVTLPAGVRLSYAGEDEQTTKSFRNLGVAFIVGLLINQIILLWEFRRLRLSLVVLSAVPLGLIGAVFGLAVTGNHFGFVAFLGIASLGGIVTNHTIVLFEYARRERDAGHSMEQALVIAGTKRLRPILLTVCASIVGLLPLAFSAQTLWRPMCWAIIFGLAFSVVMTLIAVPAIYTLAGDKDEKPLRYVAPQLSEVSA